MGRAFQVTFDAADPAALSRFWAAALEYELQPPPEGFDTWERFLEAQRVPEERWNSASALVDPEGDGPRIYFQRVPEGKTAKNRVHLDVAVTGGPSQPADERRGLQDAERDRLVALGATEVGPVEEMGGRWIVMRDPEGNEFCIT